MRHEKWDDLSGFPSHNNTFIGDFQSAAMLVGFIVSNLDARRCPPGGTREGRKDTFPRRCLSETVLWFYFQTLFPDERVVSIYADTCYLKLHHNVSRLIFKCILKWGGVKKKKKIYIGI